MMICQLTEIKDVLAPRGWIQRLSNGRVRALRSVKKRVMRFLKRARNASVQEACRCDAPTAVAAFRPGDTVRVKSKKEIRRLLDLEGRTRGCAFTHEMYRYCGQTFRVRKNVEVFFDEARQKMSRCHDMVVLEGAVCSGRQRLYVVKCDRNCHFFWQTEWLDRLA
jgi:hypothetical protein